MAKYISASNGVFINIEDVYSIRFDPKGRCFLIEGGRGNIRWLNEADGIIVLQSWAMEMVELIHGQNIANTKNHLK